MQSGNVNSNPTQCNFSSVQLPFIKMGNHKKKKKKFSPSEKHSSSLIPLLKEKADASLHYPRKLNKWLYLVSSRSFSFCRRCRCCRGNCNWFACNSVQFCMNIREDRLLAYIERQKQDLDRNRSTFYTNVSSFKNWQGFH